MDTNELERIHDQCIWNGGPVSRPPGMLEPPPTQLETTDTYPLLHRYTNWVAWYQFLVSRYTYVSNQLDKMLKESQTVALGKPLKPSEKLTVKNREYFWMQGEDYKTLSDDLHTVDALLLSSKLNLSLAERYCSNISRAFTVQSSNLDRFLRAENTTM